MLNVHELGAVLGVADAVFGAPVQLALAVPGTVPGAADVPVGFEEAPIAPKLDAPTRAQTNSAVETPTPLPGPPPETAPPGGPAPALPAGIDDFAQFLERSQRGVARRAANPPSQSVMHLVTTAFGNPQTSLQARQAAVVAILQELLAQGLPEEDARDDLEALTMTASLQAFSRNWTSNAAAAQASAAMPAAAATLAAPTAAELRRRCCALASCGEREPRLGTYKRCSACKAVVYCCKDHQLAAWPSHKAACKEARKARAEASGEPDK